MNKLSEILSILATQLGVEVSDLYSYIQNGGLTEYAKIQRINYLIWFLGSLAGIFVLYKIAKKYFEQSRIDLSKMKINPDLEIHKEIDFVLSIASFIGALIIFFSLTIPNLIKIVGWIASPEGMVLDMIMQTIS